MNSVVIGKPSFGNYSIEFSTAENIPKLPEMTFEMNVIKTLNERRKTIPKRRYLIVMSQKVKIKLQHQETLQTTADLRKNFEVQTGIIIIYEDFENSTQL